MPWMLRVFLSFAPLLFVAYFYLGLRTHQALVELFSLSSAQVRWVLLGVIGYLNLHPLLLFALQALGFGNFYRTVRAGNRVWDLFFTYPFWIGLIVVAEVVPWLLLIDVVKFPFYPFFERFRAVWTLTQHRVTLVLLALMVFYVLVRVVHDTTSIKVRRERLQVRDLPRSLNGLKIVHISDVQVDPRTTARKLRRYVRKVNKLKPDVVFFSGDLVTSGIKYIDVAAEGLAELRPRYGTYACLGDHDIWAGAHLVTERLTENGIHVFENANQKVAVGRDTLLVTILTNTYRHRPNLDTLHFLMGQQPRGAVDILLTHQPSESVIELAEDHGYHLFLAGHTHGGQIVLKPFGFTLTPAKLETPYYRGINYVGQMLVSINSGLGFTIAPLRFRAPAEITLITLLAP
ncbi:MAG: metallophosphoesterase [Calditrichaeota bacterium]|nr:MAG: metallophosphoesterase [Calditrichota bacterium]